MCSIDDLSKDGIKSHKKNLVRQKMSGVKTPPGSPKFDVDAQEAINIAGTVQRKS